MSESKGSFIWYELMTSDMDAAAAFYCKVVGWTSSDAAQPDMRYTILTAGGRGVAGIMTLPVEACDAGVRPGWIGYVGVADIEAATARVADAGGLVHKPPTDIPNVGRFSVVADPGGAVFALITPSSNEAPPPVAPDTPGLVGWRELYAADGESSAFAFYSRQFGWTESESMDMGPMGKYRIFADKAVPIGGMMNKPAEMPAGAWQYYFNVEAIDSATERVTANGGVVLMGPQEVPGGSWIIQAADPQGAMFALVAPRR
jgi:uncharacterized protein